MHRDPSASFLGIAYESIITSVQFSVENTPLLRMFSEEITRGTCQGIRAGGLLGEGLPARRLAGLCARPHLAVPAAVGNAPARQQLWSEHR